VKHATGRAGGAQQHCPVPPVTQRLCPARPIHRSHRARPCSDDTARVIPETTPSCHGLRSRWWCISSTPQAATHPGAPEGIPALRSAPKRVSRPVHRPVHKRERRSARSRRRRRFAGSRPQRHQRHRNLPRDGERDGVITGHRDGNRTGTREGERFGSRDADRPGTRTGTQSGVQTCARAYDLDIGTCKSNQRSVSKTRMCVGSCPRGLDVVIPATSPPHTAAVARTSVTSGTAT